MNGLWFLSLAISIACALFATLLQQWARRYLKATRPSRSLDKRARIRSFFAEGVEKSFLPLVVEALPTFLHLSLFLFFSGLAVFLWNVDLTIFKVVLSWIGICTALYGYISLIPLFRHDSPFCTPLTPLARAFAVLTLKLCLLARPVLILTRTVFIYLRIGFKWLFFLCKVCCSCNWRVCCSCRWDICCGLFCLEMEATMGLEAFFPNGPKEFLMAVLKRTLTTPEEAALMVSSSIDTRAFIWTLDSLDEDQELESFFSSLSDFRRSTMVDDPLLSLNEEQKRKVFYAFLRFLRFTFASNLLPEAVKYQRAIMCTKALDLAKLFREFRGDLVDVIFYRRKRQTTKFGPTTDDSPTEHTAFLQGIATGIVARPQQRDDSWFRQVAPNALGVSEAVLRGYAASGDSLSLAVLIHVTRQQFTYFKYSSWRKHDVYLILRDDSNFNARNTSPALQHEFCTLWNQIVLQAQQGDDRTIADWILEPIRNIYLTLHHDTDSAPTQFSASTSDADHILTLPSSYPVCKVAGHVHVNSASTSSADAVPHDATTVPPSFSSPDPPPSSILVPLSVIESPTDVLSLDKSHPAQPTNPNLRSSLTSAGLAIASVIRDVDSSGLTMPLPTPETSTSAPLSSGPPFTVSLQHNADQLTPSGSPNLPSSLNPVLDNMLHTGPSLSSHSLITRPSLSPSFPGSHYSTIVSTPPSASPGMTIPPDPVYGGESV